VGRDVSRDVSRRRGPGMRPGIRVHGDAVGGQHLIGRHHRSGLGTLPGLAENLAPQLLVHHVGQPDAAGFGHLVAQGLVEHRIVLFLELAVEQAALGQGGAHFVEQPGEEHRLEPLAGLAQLGGLGLGARKGVLEFGHAQLLRDVVLHGGLGGQFGHIRGGAHA